MEGLLAQARYLVSPYEGEWTIVLDGERYGPYPSQSEALQAAIAAAQGSGELGYDAEVLIEGQNGEFFPEWSYASGPAADSVLQVRLPES
jgi:hypothetical protein